jgi:DNA-binding NtrC family response regulator
MAAMHEHGAASRASPRARRRWALNSLAAHNWNIDATAGGLGQSREELVRRLEKARFGYLIKDHVLQEARRRRR